MKAMQTLTVGCIVVLAGCAGLKTRGTWQNPVWLNRDMVYAVPLPGTYHARARVGSDGYLSVSCFKHKNWLAGVQYADIFVGRDGFVGVEYAHSPQGFHACSVYCSTNTIRSYHNISTDDPCRLPESTTNQYVIFLDTVSTRTNIVTQSVSWQDQNKIGVLYWDSDGDGLPERRKVEVDGKWIYQAIRYHFVTTKTEIRGTNATEQAPAGDVLKAAPEE